MKPMKIRLYAILLGLVVGLPLNAQDHEIVQVWRTFYCATGKGCHEKICGGNKKTANGRDASIADGCAVDCRRIPYGCMVSVKSGSYVADDTFGKNQRNRDWNRNVIHVDIRVSGRPHSQVRKMGASWIRMEVIRKNGKIVKLVELK